MQPLLLEKETNALLPLFIAAQDDRRDELGRMLHNNVNQLLASARLLLQLVRDEGDVDTVLLDNGLLYLNKAIAEIRKITQSLNSGIVEDIGLRAAVEELMISDRGCRLIDTFFNYDNGLDTLLSPGMKLMVYRVIQEHLDNIYRHAGAENIMIAVRKSGDSLLFSIIDDGKGFNPKQPRRGMGFVIIQNRVASFNGTVSIVSAPGKGCRLEIEAPL